MIWKTKAEAKHSLLEFTPRMRACHELVKVAGKGWTRILIPERYLTLPRQEDSFIPADDPMLEALELVDGPI